MSQKILFKALPAIILSSLLVVAIIYAWTEPTQAPPGGNVAAPLNVGPVGQSKSGGLILNTGGAATGLIIAQGNVGIGTTNPTQRLDLGNAGRIVNVQDPVNAQDVATKAYVDTRVVGTAGGSVPRYKTLVTPNDFSTTLDEYASCNDGWTMTGGGCWCADGTGGNDSSGHGSIPNGNGWRCIQTSGAGCSGGVWTYVRCTTSAPFGTVNEEHTTPEGREIQRQQEERRRQEAACLADPACACGMQGGWWWDGQCYLWWWSQTSGY